MQTLGFGRIKSNEVSFSNDALEFALKSEVMTHTIKVSKTQLPEPKLYVDAKVVFKRTLDSQATILQAVCPHGFLIGTHSWQVLQESLSLLALECVTKEIATQVQPDQLELLKKHIEVKIDLNIPGQNSFTFLDVKILCPRSANKLSFALVKVIERV